MRVLVVSESFAPGFRGGSIRALTHMVERLGDRSEFWIITRDRDPGHPDRFSGVVIDQWTTWGPARVLYRSRRHSAFGLHRAIRDASPDVLFLNSVFGTGSWLTLALRRLGVVRVPIVIAPEGELSPGALAQKPRRKQVFLRAARIVGLFEGVQWVAREPAEVTQVRKIVGSEARAALVPYLDPVAAPPEPVTIRKEPGRVRLIYLSRVTPKKNLRFLLEMLRDFAGDVELDVVGPIDDRSYWASCERLAAALPPIVRMRYHGECPPEKVGAWLARAHVMVLPTLGENYGYVIAEALAAGRPVLVSDLTPWSGLEAASAGWNVPLDRGHWSAVLRLILGMPDHEYQLWSAGARRYAALAPSASDVELATLKILETTAAGRSGHEP